MPREISVVKANAANARTHISLRHGIEIGENLVESFFLFYIIIKYSYNILHIYRYMLIVETRKNQK